MKPGKPLSVGSIGNAVFVGLPKYPVAAYTTWKIIGSRIAEGAAGCIPKPEQCAMVEAHSTTTRRPGRQEYRPARIVGTSSTGHPQIELLDHTFSAKISLICKSDGFAVIPPEMVKIQAGDPLEFLFL
jgi:molybdopterin molybdotransferase